MITYSREDMQRQLISDQRLWRRIPGAASAILWPFEAILLGWDTARWTGPATVILVAFLCTALPPRVNVSLYLLDLVDSALVLPMWLGWLLLVWHLAAREQLFPILGVPAAGAVLVTAVAWVTARLLTLAVGFLARRVLPRNGSSGA